MDKHSLTKITPQTAYQWAARDVMNSYSELDATNEYRIMMRPINVQIMWYHQKAPKSRHSPINSRLVKITKPHQNGNVL